MLSLSLHSIGKALDHIQENTEKIPCNYLQTKQYHFHNSLWKALHLIIIFSCLVIELKFKIVPTMQFLWPPPQEEMPYIQKYPMFNVTMYIPTFTAFELICRLHTLIIISCLIVNYIIMFLRRNINTHSLDNLVYPRSHAPGIKSTYIHSLDASVYSICDHMQTIHSCHTLIN